MKCLRCGTQNQDAAERCQACHQLLDETEWLDASQGYSGIVPGRNPPALIAYYLGVFSIIPLLGFLLGIAALILGLRGRKIAIEKPEVKGTAHAWIGILLGGFFVLVHLVVVLLVVVA